MIRLVDTPELLIEHHPGTQPYAVISCAGVGIAEAGIPKPEFAKTLADTCEGEHIFYVIDRTLSWYNHTYDDCITHLTQALQEHGIKGVTTLGNSMGGTGAIAIGANLPGFQGALVFAPQMGAANDVVGHFETRWNHYFAAIKNWTIPSLAPFLRNGQNTIILGDRSWQDLKHADAMLKAMNGPEKLLVVRGFGHEAASGLRETGTLTKLIQHTLRPWATPPKSAAQILAADGYDISIGTLPWTGRTRFRALRHKLLGANASTGHRRRAKKLAK